MNIQNYSDLCYFSNLSWQSKVYHVCVHTCISVHTVYRWSCWDFSCLTRPGHEKRKTWRENSWKERNPLMILAFSCVALSHHISPPCHTCVLTHTCMCLHQSPTNTGRGLFLCPSYITVSASTLSSSPTPLPPVFIVRLCSCHARCFQLKVFRCITPPHASGKSQSNPSNQEHWALCRRDATWFNHRILLSATRSSGFKGDRKHINKCFCTEAITSWSHNVT